MKNLTVKTSNNVSEPKVMTSIEVAKMSGKQHKNVIRDIDNLVNSLSSDLSLGYKSTTYKDSTGKSNRMYTMDKEASICLVSGYDANTRMLIIKRWLALESGLKAIPKEPVEVVHQLTLINKPRFRIREFLAQYSDISLGVEEFISNMNNNTKADLEDRNRTLSSLRKAVNESYDSLSARDITQAALCERALKLIAEKERYLARRNK